MLEFMSMNQVCKQCRASFEIRPEDLAFYERVSPVFVGKKYPIPPPTLCPVCRLQRRLAHINESKLYRRTSSKSGKEILSIFSPDKALQVYEAKEWWGDDWDPMQYGHSIDTLESCRNQFVSLMRSVPLQALYVDNNENSDYVNYSGWSKNCYLCFCTDYAEDCEYCHGVYYTKNTMDSSSTLSSELCYECVSCTDCYSVFFSQDCSQCSDSAFLLDCSGCKNCFGCTGLRQKQFCLFNEQLSKDDYERKRREIKLSSEKMIRTMRERIVQIAKNHPRRFYSGQNNENVTGNFLSNCKNAFTCYDSTDLEDCKYCHSMRGAKDCYDISYWGHPGELCYECLGVGEGILQSAFCYCCWNSCSNLYYCFSCLACQDCFLCVGLQKKQYCILNTQYTKEEYERMVPKIIERMIRDEEWGEFFPVQTSLFCYNESVAQEYFPLMKAEVLKRGWKWNDYEAPLPKVEKIIPAAKLPDTIADIPDDILRWAIECEVTKRPFKIIKQELEFYRKMQLPIPRLHPDERRKRRMTLRNPRRLWNRTCAKCKTTMMTTYAPERPEIVYCEECYRKTVY